MRNVINKEEMHLQKTLTDIQTVKKNAKDTMEHNSNQNHGNKFETTVGLNLRETSYISTFKVKSQSRSAKTIASYPQLTKLRKTFKEETLKKRKRRYVLQGSQWDKEIINYLITVPSTDLSLQDQNDVMRNSFLVWAQVCPLRFRKADNSINADMKIEFKSSKVLSFYFWKQIGGFHV